ncbi:E3 UFM1-protein ligase 1 [Galendromus occidentalis]|uniref:E3 UFM1-protein ligase 1 homolog n=1 Tax=Galendromus occidentalis TaxID=34638 RepID=A0AAJ6QN70_9ACAR|nr:E3 UFM1-protein ligase 1 [Galendromus occidentalis]
MASSWEEVKLLAADFQRAQLTSSIQRLSDRNCIEIVKKLISLKLIDVVFTTSGKEYITPQHLQKEINDELIVAGGRIDLSTLATTLQVDISHIEKAVPDVLRSDKGTKLVLDQLITESYMDQLAEEVNEKLQQKGELSIAEIIEAYDMPTDSLRSSLLSRMGSIVKGQTDDKEVIFTEAFVTMHRYRIRGILTAVTRPVQMSTLIKNYALPQRVVFNIVEQLISQKKLLGSLSGQRERAIYSPEIYSRAQRDWVNDCFKQNGFLEYDALRRLGIVDPETYAKTILQGTKVLFLSSACVGERLLDQIEASVEEAHLTGSWVDVVTMLPSQLTSSDVQQVVSTVIGNHKSVKDSMHIIADSIVASNALIESCLRTFEPLMVTKGEKDLQSGVARAIFTEKEPCPDEGKRGRHGDDEDVETSKKDERRKKAASGKSGGGTQGRETKTKATKKKYGKKRANDSDSDEDETPRGKHTAQVSSNKKELVFMSRQEIVKHLVSLELLQDCPDELASGIGDFIERQLAAKYRQVVRSMFMSSMNASATSRRKTHSELQEKITVALGSISLYANGLDVFDGELKSQLSRYLLRSLCTDLVNSIVIYLASEQGTECESESLSTDARLKLINKLNSTPKEVLLKIHQNLNGGTIDDFLATMETVCGAGVLDMMIRSDRKRDRQTMTSHKMSLLQQLETSSDPALTLHIAVSILVQIQLQRMVHFSGKFVPQMIAFLRGKIEKEVFEKLVEFQNMVMKSMSTEDPEEKSRLNESLAGDLKTLKELVGNYKRLSESK